MNDTLISALLDPLKERSSQSGIFFDTDDGRSSFRSSFLSYPSLYQKILTAAHHFRSVGIVKGSKVIFPFATSEDGIAAFFALIRAGAIPLSVKTPPSHDSSKEYAKYLLGLIARFHVNFIVNVVGLDQVLLPASVQRISVSAEPQHSAEIDWIAPTAEEIAYVQFSPDANSEAKGVSVKHSQVIAQLKMLTLQDTRKQHDIAASWLPLYDETGLIGTLFTALYAGHNVHLCSPAQFFKDPVKWLSDLSEQGVSITNLPHFGAVYLMKKLQGSVADLHDIHLEHVRRIYIGGDMIDAFTVNQLADQLKPYGLSRTALTPCYGMAEAGLMVSCKSTTPVKHDLLRVSNRMAIPIASVGTLLPGFDLRVMRADGTFAETGSEAGAKEDICGEIYLRGGTLSDSYFEDDEPLLGDNGFYHTGDMGYVEAGELYITGRIGELINIEGNSYYLSYLENALQIHPELSPGGGVIISESGQLLVFVELDQLRSEAHLLNLRTELVQLLLLLTGLAVPEECVIFVGHGEIKRSNGNLKRDVVRQAFIDENLKNYELGFTAA